MSSQNGASIGKICLKKYFKVIKLIAGVKIHDFYSSMNTFKVLATSLLKTSSGRTARSVSVQL
jgi:hypothetical protein